MDLNDEELKLAEELAGVISEEEKLDKTSKREVTKKVSEILFGPGVADKRINVRWGSLFGRQSCPACEGTVTKNGDKYACNKCGLEIPAELYERARGQHMKETELAERERVVNVRMDGMGLPPEKVDEIYATAIERAALKVKRGGV